MVWTSAACVRVRAATAADLPALLAFGVELRDQLLPVDGCVRNRTAVSRPALEDRYVEALADPARQLVLAVGGKDGAAEEPLGMALFTVAPTNALLDLPAVHMSHALVSDRHRRRGAGKALVAAATTYAEERGLDQLVVSVHPGSREANRFYARLGFAPLAVRRVAPVAVVRRQLSLAERTVDSVARRRPRRAVRTVPALPLGPAEDVDRS